MSGRAEADRTGPAFSIALPSRATAVDASDPPEDLESFGDRPLDTAGRKVEACTKMMKGETSMSRDEQASNRQQLPTWRAWVEVILASVSGLLAVGTLVLPDWLEVIFHLDPDHGSGSFEVLIVATFVIACVVLGVAARYEWRRLKQHRVASTVNGDARAVP